MPTRRVAVRGGRAPRARLRGPGGGPRRPPRRAPRTARRRSAAPADARGRAGRPGAAGGPAGGARAATTADGPAYRSVEVHVGVAVVGRRVERLLDAALRGPAQQ